jgi:toxin secretion/phage lysis holin
MRENIFKTVIAGALTVAATYFEMMILPLGMLMCVMIIDYITGITSAYIQGNINSRIGFVGIIKKLSYLCAVAVGMVADWIIHSSLATAGVESSVTLFVGLLVVIWLIINELISILENLAKIGTPLPPFLTKLVSKLKISVENETKDME